MAVNNTTAIGPRSSQAVARGRDASGRVYKPGVMTWLYEMRGNQAMDIYFFQHAYCTSWQEKGLQLWSPLGNRAGLLRVTKRLACFKCYQLQLQRYARGCS